VSPQSLSDAELERVREILDRFGDKRAMNLVIARMVVNRRANIAMAIGMMICDRTGTPLRFLSAWREANT
jgi:hypothetical protein